MRAFRSILVSVLLPVWIPPLASALLALAMVLHPGSPARAEDIAAKPILTVPAPAVAELDVVAGVLRLFQPDAVFVGRTKDGAGYVLLSSRRGYVVRPQPGGIIRVIPADPQAIMDLVRVSGWSL